MKNKIGRVQFYILIAAALFVAAGMSVCLLVSVAAKPVEITACSRLADDEMTLDTIPRFRLRSFSRDGEYGISFSVGDRTRFVDCMQPGGGTVSITEKLIPSTASPSKYDRLRIYRHGGLYYYCLIPSDESKPLLFSELSGTVVAASGTYRFPCLFTGAVLDPDGANSIKQKWLDTSVPGVLFPNFETLAAYYSALPEGLAEIDYANNTVTLSVVINEPGESGNTSGEPGFEVSAEYSVIVTCDDSGIKYEAVRKGKTG